eukprot:TRINITY_DN1204_c2_g1_i1.p1 TRINITY_DN1204_c2_g1~~TRINITY_DN1204_c2_g1_i1.p1  ORF type:complete len:844 (+),score=140.18 TRINITY_DN1204_c2_g1_i1:81-2612(+)
MSLPMMRAAQTTPATASTWHGQGPLLAAGTPRSTVVSVQPAAGSSSLADQAMRANLLVQNWPQTVQQAGSSLGGVSTPRHPAPAPQMVVRLPSYTPRVARTDDSVGSATAPSNASTSSWSPELAAATWPPAPGTARSTLSSALSSIATPRDESPDSAMEKAALRAKLRILPSSKATSSTGGGHAQGSGASNRAASPGSRSLSPASRKGSRPSALRLHSPRSALRRSSSSAGPSSLGPGSYTAGPSTAATSTAPTIAGTKESGSSQKAEQEDIRLENARLQGQLCKARTMISLLRKQLDDASAARDRERLRAESLQNVARELQRRLEEETAKSSVLQRTISNAISQNNNNSNSNSNSNGTNVPGPLQGRDFSSPRGRAPHGTQPGARRGGPGSGMFRHDAGGSHRPDKSIVENEEDDEHLGLDDIEDQEVENHGRPIHRRQFSVSTGGGKHVSLGTLPEEGESEEDDSPKHLSTAPEGKGVEQEDAPRSWEYVVQGQYDRSFSEQLDFAPKLVSCFPEEAVASAKSRGVAFVCSRGRRADSGVPNQDDFVLARHSLANDGHIALYGVFDGHGPAGHHCAAYARGLLPESLFGQGSLIAGPEEALRVAFSQVQEGMLQQPFDSETSGTTATVALVLHLPAAEEDASAQVESWLYVANVGDSRAVLVSRKDADPSEFSVNRLTREHRPDDKEEAERIQSEGGEVRQLRPGSGTSRIFAPGCQWPALALTRSLGAAVASSCGVSSEPEVTSVRLNPDEDELLILGTDGLFEFCNTKEVATRLSTDGVADEVLEDICAVARRRWARSSYNDTVDDITVVAVSLEKSLGSPDYVDAQGAAQSEDAEPFS